MRGAVWREAQSADGSQCVGNSQITGMENARQCTGENVRLRPCNKGQYLLYFVDEGAARCQRRP